MSKVAPTKIGADDVRTVTLTAHGDFLLHGHKVSKDARARGPVPHRRRRSADGRPDRIELVSKTPLHVVLADHDVKPRDNTGKLAQAAFGLLGTKVAETADVSIEIQATPARGSSKPCRVKATRKQRSIVMRANLSLDHIAATLAALGTSAILVGCGGADAATPPPAAPVTDSAAATTPTAAPTPADPAAAATPTGAASSAATAADTSAASSAAMTAPATAATPAAATPAAATPATTPATAATPKGTKKGGAKKGASAGQASCGAGTCSGDAKK